MIAASVASTTSGSSAHVGAIRKNGWRAPSGFEQQQRALAEVVEHQRRQHQPEPGQPDRPPAEVAHVGVQRLAAGDARTTAPSTGKPCQPLSRKKLTAWRGSSAPSTAGSRTIQTTPSTASVDEPDHHDRAEQPADAARAVLLDDEEADDDRHRERHDLRVEERRDDLSPSIAPSTVIAGVIMPSP